MKRKNIQSVVQADVVIKSKRRCALCFGINGDDSDRPGQIAHINGDNTDSRFDNLVWLCLEHHDKFDSKTSQTKNYTQIEVKRYRDKLYQKYASSEYNQEDIFLIREYLQKYSSLFTYIFHEYTELASQIHYTMLESLAEIRDFWHTNILRSFNPDIREIQDHIANNIVGILSIYEISMYDSVNSYIQFNKRQFSSEILVNKRQEAKAFVDSILSYYKQLEKIAVTKI